MTPTNTQSLAAFEAGKKVVEDLVENLVGSWAEIGFNDDEIHRITDAAVEAALSVNPNARPNEKETP